MIGKIKKGSGFKGCVNYVLGKEQAVLLHADGVLTESRGDIIRSFCMQTGMNPDLKKPVGHIALSYSAVDAPKLTDEKMVQLAQEYMREMKITDTQYIIVRHQDREHPHVHIVFNRIDNNGKTISDRNDRFRSERICKELIKKYGLHFANGKEQVKVERLREPDKTRYGLYQILKAEVGRCKDWNTLLERLKRQGVDVQFKYKGQTNEIQGIVFTMNGYRFNGSKIDRAFSYSKIDAALSRNNYEERQMRPQPHPQSNRDEISQISDSGGNLIEGSLGLFSPSNQPEEQQPYDPYLRNKKKKKQRKINW